MSSDIASIATGALLWSPTSRRGSSVDTSMAMTQAGFLEAIWRGLILVDTASCFVSYVASIIRSANDS